MARAKNTSRADARRRTRETARAEQQELDAAESGEETAQAADAQPQQRAPLFKMPDFRGDVRALPMIFRTKPLVWVPLLLLLAGLVIAFALDMVPAEVGGVLQLYLQFFFIPPALFTFFIAGFVAPRASYMVGALYGLVAGVIWSIVILSANTSLSSGTTANPTDFEPIAIVGNMLLIGVLYGTLAAAFAAWYRDFLRGMQDRGKQRRLDQEAKERERRRAERQDARKAAKRPT